MRTKLTQIIQKVETALIGVKRSLQLLRSKEMKNYFTIQELCYSYTAERNKIDNSPTEEVKKHLEELIQFLNPLRDAWGGPITVSSGYRCSELNSLIKGSKTSAHCIGYAADLIPTNKEIKKFKEFCKEYLQDKVFDQCLLESDSKDEWVHIGLKRRNGDQRRQIKIYNV